MGIGNIKKIISIMLLLTLTNDNCFPINIKPVKERPEALESLTRELLGARLSYEDDKLVMPMFANEIDAVNYGDEWNGDLDRIRMLALYEEVLEKKYKKAFKYQDENFYALWKELKLIRIALMVMETRKPEGARFAWTKVETDWPYKPLIYAAIFLASIMSVRCCIPAKKDDGRESRIYPDEKGEHDIAWQWEVNGLTFVYFPRNSKLYIKEGEKMRRPTQSEHEMFLQARLPMGGARLAAQPIKVIDLGTGHGEFLPRIKEWLEKRGFKEVWVLGLDNGDWMHDDTLPKPDTQMKKDAVELSDNVIMGKHGGAHRIYYTDVFKHFPKEFIQEFDFVFLNAVPQNMTVSFVHRALRLLKGDGMIVLRYQKNSRNFMNLEALMAFAKEQNLSVDVIHSADMPTGDTELYITAYLIQRGKFAWRHNALNISELFIRMAKGARMAGRSA